MKRVDIFISKAVESKTEAATLVTAITNKLKDQIDITIRAEYQDVETIETKPVTP